MSTSRASSSTSRRRAEDEGDENWVKLKKYNCEEGQIFDVKFSASRRNPGRPYYKCSGCGSFDWVKEDDMSNSGRVQHQSAIEEDVGQLKDAVGGLMERSTIVVKMVMVLYLVLLICVMMK